MLTTRKAHHPLTFPDLTGALSAWGMAIVTASFLLLVWEWIIDGTFRLDPVFVAGLVLLAVFGLLARMLREE